MENASKALLMAGGILIGVLILALMTVLFLSGNEFFGSYEETKNSEAVQQFNSNFTKYVGQDLTAHQVVTICNFAENNSIHKVTICSGRMENGDIKTDLVYLTDSDVKMYKLNIVEFSQDGYVDKITFST